MSASLASDSDLYCEAREAAELLLHDYYGLREPLWKALNPQRPADFLIIQNRIARSLQRAASGGDAAAAVRRAINALDVDWPNLTPQAREEVFRAIRAGLTPIADYAVPRVESALTIEARPIVASSRRSIIAQYDLRIPASLSLRDQRAIDWLPTSNANFVRDEYGRRRERFSEQARGIVTSGLEAGLGRDDIAQQLQGALTTSTMSRDMNYWRIVAGSFVGRARSFSNVNAFDEAGIVKYRFDAVLDEVTSEICRFMHGRVFEVKRAVQRIDRVQRSTDPEAVVALQPWANVGVDAKGNSILYFNRGDTRHTIAEIESSGMGERDAVGSYNEKMTDAQLEAAGVTVPPLHGSCRSTITAEV